MVRLDEYFREHSREGELAIDSEFFVDENVGTKLKQRPWPMETLHVL
jgi:hypothetical protein